MNTKYTRYILFFITFFDLHSSSASQEKPQKTRFQRLKKYARKKSKTIRKNFRQKKHQLNVFFTHEYDLKNQLNTALRALPDNQKFLIQFPNWQDVLIKKALTGEEYTIFDLIAYGPENYTTVADWFKNASDTQSRFIVSLKKEYDRPYNKPGTKEENTIKTLNYNEQKAILDFFNQAESTFKELLRLQALTPTDKKIRLLSLAQEALNIESSFNKKSGLLYKSKELKYRPTGRIYQQERYAHFFGKMAEFFQSLSNRAAKGDTEMIIEVPAGKDRPFVPKFKPWKENLFCKDKQGRRYPVSRIIALGETYYPIAIKALKKAAQETDSPEIKNALSLAAKALIDLTIPTFEDADIIQQLEQVVDKLNPLESLKDLCLTFKTITDAKKWHVKPFMTPDSAPEFED